MKLFVVVLATAVAMVVAECDSSKYKKIGCFGIDEQAPDNFEEVMDTNETFNIDNYKEVLPQLVCDCLEKTKDNYKYFSIGHNGHCHGSMTFHGNRRNNEAGCIDSGEHSAGLTDHEYVYQIKADAATPIDGGSSDFGPWGECSKSCGGGRRSRERACIKPLPNDPGKGCDDLTEVEECNAQPCPINGSWGEWSEYNTCDAECGPGSQQRVRKCDSPATQYGGDKCEGESEQNKDCNLKPCPINGSWGEWSEYNTCDSECGPGSQQRVRKCNSPAAQYGGDECEGESEQNEDCNLKPCPINGGWSLWSEYSRCSADCGKGTQDRSRKCDHPAPQHGGKDCNGKSEQTRTCVLKSCVENAEAVECEDNKVELSCRSNWALKIKQSSSYYGRKDNDRCTKFYNINWNTDCKTGADKMASFCDNKQSCKFDCSNSVFGDPCRLTKKYCMVKYQCVGYDL